MKKLHNAEDAIKQAIEGGWLAPKQKDFGVESIGGVTEVSVYDKGDVQFVFQRPAEIGTPFYHAEVIDLTAILTDPLFWQALGKARGWDEEPVGTPDGGYANISWESVALDWFLERLRGMDETKFWESLT